MTTPAQVTREHRAAAAQLAKVKGIQPRCVEQWIDGMALPYWAVEPFAEVVRVAQALADFEARGRERTNVCEACGDCLEPVAPRCERHVHTEPGDPEWTMEAP